MRDGSIEPQNLIFLDESGVKQEDTITHSWSPKGQPSEVKEPKGKKSHTTIVGAISLFGLLAAMICDCTFDQYGFQAFIENFLGPHIGPGTWVIMDNVSFHKVKSVVEIIESTGAKVVFLPPYHPELNPIEMMWAKIKPTIRKLTAQGIEFCEAVKRSLESVSREDCEGWFEKCDAVPY